MFKRSIQNILFICFLLSNATPTKSSSRENFSIHCFINVKRHKNFFETRRRRHRHRRFSMSEIPL